MGERERFLLLMYGDRNSNRTADACFRRWIKTFPPTPPPLSEKKVLIIQRSGVSPNNRFNEGKKTLVDYKCVFSIYDNLKHTELQDTCINIPLLIHCHLTDFREPLLYRETPHHCHSTESLGPVFFCRKFPYALPDN